MIHNVAAAAQAAAPKPAELVQLGSPSVITHRRGVVVLTDAAYSIVAHITKGTRVLTVKGPDITHDWVRLFDAIFAEQPFVPDGIEAAFTYGGTVTIRHTPWVLHGDAELAKVAAAVLPRIVVKGAFDASRS